MESILMTVWFKCFILMIKKYMLSSLYYKTKGSVTVLYPHESYFMEENKK